MALGGEKRQEDAIKEPIAIVIRPARTGLGVKRGIQETVIPKSSSMNPDDIEIPEEYRVTQRRRVEDRFVRKDVTALRKAIQQMDEQNEIERHALWFPVREGPLLDEPVYRRTVLEREIAAEEPEEDKETKFEDLEPTDQLDTLTKYARDEYFYCCWCGCRFTGAQDLKDNCPGNERDLHDDL
jgi:hypothetical protein